MSKSEKLVFNPWENAAVWVMLSPPEGLWQEAQVIDNVRAEVAGDPWIFHVELEAGGSHKVSTSAIDKAELEFEWVKKRDPNTAGHVNTTDMTSLTYLNEAEMIECMRLRFLAKKIYTDTGPILMAINPFERLPLYTPEQFQKYFNAQSDTKLEPHVYKMSDVAYRKMFVDKFDPDKRENQTILVNGESGAGKTEATKQVLKYLSLVSGEIIKKLGMANQCGDVENQIVASNPITESFGNAKTSRNNNSSRFGKFIELGYSADGYIEGATIRTYLLETVRIAKQFKGERNYHLFYEVDAGLSEKQKTEYGITSLKDFQYTNQSGEYNRHDDENDPDNYTRLRNAMTTMKISLEFQELIMKLICGVLHIGNIVFEESASAGEESAGFSSNCAAHVKCICSLFGVSEDSLLTAVARRSVTIAGSSIQKTLNKEGANFAKDTFAKLVYDNLFKWTVAEVNKAMTANVEGESASFVGVLDIFGFEFFAKNSFEQLCINYTNEKLQDHFNFAIFKSEQEVYISEGLKWTAVDYPDNSARLELLEHNKIGIYALCDEQLKVPKCSDEKFAKSLYDKCGKHKYFSASKAEQMKCEFVVKHFACDVKYQAEGFLDKNRSDVAKEFQDCFNGSSNPLFRLLASNEEPQTKTPAAKGRPGATIGKKSASTVSTAFSKQLGDLVAKIRTTRSHFIRCIKSNSLLKPGIIDQTMVMKQLRCGGALGAVQVFRSGFPNRMDFMSFIVRFGCCGYPCGRNKMTKDLNTFIKEGRRTGSDKAWMNAAARLIDVVPVSEMVLDMIDGVEPEDKVNMKAGLQMGRTQIFMRAEVYENMERLYFRTVNLVARRMQNRYRSYVLAKTRGSGHGQSLQECMVHFTEHRRESACRKLRSAIVVQQRAKVYLEVMRRRRIIRGCVLVSARFKGYVARKRVKKMFQERLANRVIPIVRGFLARGRVRKIRRAKEEARLRAAGLEVPAEPIPVPKAPGLKAPPPPKKTAPPPPPPPSNEEVLRLEAKLKEAEEAEKQKAIALAEKMAALEAEKKREAEELAAKQAAEKAAAEKAAAELKEKIAKAESDIQAAKAEAAAVGEERNAGRLEIAKLKTELEKSKANVVALEEEKKKTREDIKASQGSVVTMRSQLSSMENERDNALADVDVMKLKITTLQAEISIIEEERNCARAEAEQARTDSGGVRESMADIEKELTALRDENIRIKVDVTSLRTQNGILEEERSNAKSAAAAARAELASVRTQIAVMEVEETNLKKEIEQLKENVISLETQGKSFNKETDLVRLEIERLKGELTNQRKMTQTVEEEKAGVLASVMQAKTEISSLRNQMTMLQKQKDESKSAAQSAKKEIASIQASLTDAVQSKTAAHMKEMIKLQDTLSTVEEERDILRAESVKANQQVTKIQSQMQTVLEAQSAKSHSEAEVARKQIELLEAKIMALEARLAKASLAQVSVRKSPKKDSDTSFTDNRNKNSPVTAINDTLRQKEASEQIEYLKSQVLSLTDQRDKSTKLVAALRARINELKEDVRSGSPMRSPKEKPLWK